MDGESVVLVALEDVATAGVVAAAAAHHAAEMQARRVVLLHVLDDHLRGNSLFGFAGAPIAAVETDEECRTVLKVGETALLAEYGGMNADPPEVSSQVSEGNPGRSIAAAAEQCGAAVIVLGARRPHALGRLTHPDVADFLHGHASARLHIVNLQA